MGASTLQFLPRSDQVPRLRADRFRNVDQVGFMRFEETEERRKQGRLRGAPAQVVCVDSGQVQEPPRAAFVRQCGGKR
jgi:hypothetical protein